MTTITLPRAVVEQALHVAESAGYPVALIKALRAALEQAEPLNLSDPAVQKRLAAQWGYVHEAQQAEPVQEPVAWMFELARNFNLEGYGGWKKRITEYRPNCPEGSVRNVTPLCVCRPLQRKLVPLTEEVAALTAQRDALLGALNDIANTDPVDAALDPQRAVRIARAAIRARTP